jgi:integrase/recombinase XerD
MVPESFAETSQTRLSQPARSRCGFPAGRRRSRNVGLETFEKLSTKLRERSLPGIELAESYLLHLYRKNRRPNTLELNYTSIRLFQEYLKSAGITYLEGVSRKNLEAFVEHEQDRGLKPVSVRGRLASVKAFLRFLIEEGVVRSEVLSKSLAVKVPDSLPRAIAPEDVRELLSVVDVTRNRAMVLMLLRTGMRIGELLSLRMEDIDLSEQKVFIYEARKTGVGRVVYFSADAKDAINAWLKEKDPREDVLFYGKKI